VSISIKKNIRQPGLVCCQRGTVLESSEFKPFEVENWAIQFVRRIL